MPNVVCVGAQWGDEGKGKVIDWLTPRAELVVRFQGGPNAGHTLVVDGEKTVLHIIPSGILHEGAQNVVGPGVVIDPDVLLAEIDGLAEKGIPIQPGRLLISDRAHLILPVHRSLDLAREESHERITIGTTGRGIGPAYEDRVARSGIRVCDLLDLDELRERLEPALAERNFVLEKRYGWPAVEIDQVLKAMDGWAERLAPFIDDTGVTLDKALRAGRSVLFEGAQGTLLDVDHGTYPFVTSSNTVAGGACAGAGIGPTAIDGVLGISKAYTTRVGGGPFPTQDDGPAAEHLSRVGDEFGATTGRKRRCGWLDLVVLRHAVRVNGITQMALTKLDILTGLPEIKVCTGYRVPDKLRRRASAKGTGSGAEGTQEIRELPASIRTLEACEPIYRSFPGWSTSISSARRLTDLPAEARDYVSWIESELEVPTALVGVGQDRTEVIESLDPFGAGRS